MREISVRGVRSLSVGVRGTDLRQGRLSATKTRLAPCHGAVAGSKAWRGPRAFRAPVRRGVVPFERGADQV